jgi:hypothetical protein
MKQLFKELGQSLLGTVGWLIGVGVILLPLLAFCSGCLWIIVTTVKLMTN